MKKILFATTALVATASVAAADVTFSGYGRFGVKYSGSVAEVAAKAGTAYKATDVSAMSAGVVKTALATVDNTSGAQVDETVVKQSALLRKAIADQEAALAAATGTGSTQSDLKAIQDKITALTAAETAMGAADQVAAIASDTLITSRLHLNINATAESDSGITFGARLTVEQNDGNTNSFNAARFYAKSGGLELAVGNINGVIDSMPGLYSGTVGLTGLGFANLVSHGGMSYVAGGAGSAGTKEAAEVIYSMGDYGFHVSTDGTDTEYGVSATMSGWTVGLSGSDTDTAASSEWVATVGGKIGGVALGLATAEDVSGDSATTLSASFDVAAATSVTAYYSDDESHTVDDKSYGIGFVHGLGGGTSLRGGVVSVEDRTYADFGVRFNF